MVATARRPLGVVVGVVLVSSAGLLVGGLLSLWHSARAAELSAAVSSERAAAIAARALREALDDPAQLARHEPKGRVFQLRDGRLAPPAGFSWLVTPPPEDPWLELPIEVLTRVRAAEASEREREHDSGAAGAAFDEALTAATELAPKQRRWVELAAAWSAQRRGDDAVRDARLASLLEKPDFAAGAWYRSAVAGTLLLAAKAGRTLASDAMREAFAMLETAQLDALLSELSPEPAVRALADEVRVRRHVIAAVDPLAARLAQASAALHEPVGDEVLLWYPATSSGALVPPAELVAGAADGGGRFVFGAAPPADALPVVALVSLVPGKPPRMGLFAGSRGLATLLVVLAATVGLGLVLALRMVRREVALTTARARFLTNVTHELKTPLASIRLFSEMLLERRVPSEAKRDEYHRLLAGESERLSALIENVLDLGRLERGERALDLQPQPVGDVVREVVERFAPLAERDGLRVSTHGLEQACRARCDRGALAQALLNLLENARKYAAAGARVELSLENANGRAAVHVRDFGPGVPEEERDRVFEAFVRGERQRDGAIPGLGLGLHLARTLLRAQGGELRCVSPADGGAGACFVAELPLDDGVQMNGGPGSNRGDAR